MSHLLNLVFIYVLFFYLLNLLQISFKGSSQTLSCGTDKQND